MPWQASEAKSHTKKADTPAKQKKWAKIANAALKTYKGNEGKAIATANAAMGDAFWQRDEKGLWFDTAAWNDQRRLLRDANGDDDDADEEDRDEDEDEDDDREARYRCPECDGKGFVHGRTCQACDGDGFIDEDEKMRRTSAFDYRAPFRDAVYDREWTAEQRKSAAEEGEAMPGGGFPIKTKADLDKARQALGRAKDRDAAIRHIKKRAKALGVKLPENWPNDSDIAKSVLDASDSIIRMAYGDHLPNPEAREVTLYDKVEFDDKAGVRFTDDGYLVATPRIARTGIQKYLGRECGLTEDGAGDQIINVYRPPHEVFDNNAIHSFAHRPVTLDHPPEPVTAQNWKKYAVGQTGDEVLRDGGSIRVPMVLMDQDAIQAFKNGTKQLSVGYACDLEWKDGVTEDGEPYQAIQKGIRANHLAVVAAARGGSQLTIGDNRTGDTNHHQQGEGAMNTPNLKTILIDGLELQMTDMAALHVQRTIRDLESKIANYQADAKKKADEDEERDEADQKKDAAIVKLNNDSKAKDEVIKAKDGEIAVLKQQVADAQMTPQKLNKYVVDRLEVINKAKHILGEQYQVGDKSDDDIRKDVVTARLGDVAKSMDTSTIRGAFEALSAVRTHDAVPSGHTSVLDTALRAFGGSHGRPGGGYQHIDARDAAYAEYEKELANGYRTKAQ